MSHLCEEKDCLEEAVRCHLVDYSGAEPQDCYYYYCTAHAPTNGFCYICGEFRGGLEEFDFAECYGNIKGLCPHCSDQVKANDEIYEDEAEIYDY